MVFVVPIIRLNSIHIYHWFRKDVMKGDGIEWWNGKMREEK